MSPQSRFYFFQKRVADAYEGHVKDEQHTEERSVCEREQKRQQLEEEKKEMDTLTVRQFHGNKHIHLCHTQRVPKPEQRPR